MTLFNTYVNCKVCFVLVVVIVIDLQLPKQRLPTTAHTNAYITYIQQVILLYNLL